MNDMWGLLIDIWEFHKERSLVVQWTKMSVYINEFIMNYMSCFLTFLFLFIQKYVIKKNSQYNFVLC